MSLPPATDVLVVAGDRIDKPGQQSIQLGRRVLRRFDCSAVPTIVIPGNHDPLATIKQLVADFETVYLAHQRRLTTEELLTNATTQKNITVVGWGCTRFDVGREIPDKTAETFDILRWIRTHR